MRKVAEPSFKCQDLFAIVIIGVGVIKYLWKNKILIYNLTGASDFFPHPVLIYNEIAETAETAEIAEIIAENFGRR